jgi:hypothetical protein
MNNVFDYTCGFHIDMAAVLEAMRGNKERDPVVFKTCRRKPLPWRDELIETAKHIRRVSAGHPLYVCMSGGIDSEVIARSFLTAGIPFEAVTFRHVQGTNEHDIAYAFEWCYKNDVKLNVIPFDVTEFFVSGIPRIIEQGYYAGVGTHLSYMYIHMARTISSMGGVAIMGSGETLFKSDGKEVSLEFRMWWHNNCRYLFDNPKHFHFPWFFKTTPEMIAAYLEEELVQLVTRDPTYYQCAPLPEVQTLEKTIVYHKNFPDMRRRPKNTGWEVVYEKNPIVNRWIDERRLNYRYHAVDRLEYIPVSKVRTQLGLSGF